MELFSIDHDKCKKDGICASVCPMGLVTLKTEDGFPAPVKLANDLCMNCGHCIAVCPHGAFSLRTMGIDDCPPVQPELLPQPAQIEHLFRFRRSIRRYKDDPVPHDILGRLVDMAHYAPTGHNRQPVCWLVVENPDEVRLIAGLTVDWMRLLVKETPDAPETLIRKRIAKAWDLGMDYICHHAPHLVIAHELEREGFDAQDSIIALTHLDLAAAALNLGACWAGLAKQAANAYAPLRRTLDIPKDHQVIGALMIGYPKFQYQRLPLRNEANVRWGLG